eukprot:11194133-Lingulodinium_polyedra.AAC.1
MDVFNWAKCSPIARARAPARPRARAFARQGRFRGQGRDDDVHDVDLGLCWNAKGRRASGGFT